VVKTDLKVQNIDQAIEKIISKYEEENLDFSWSISPYTNPINFADYLKKYDFKELDQIPHMGLLHSNIDKQQLEQELNDSELEIIEFRIDNLEEYMNLFSIGFGLSENQQLIKGFNIHLKFHMKFNNSISEGSSIFVGYVNDQAVSISMGFISDGVMGIYNIATVPKFRRKGYGRLMTIDLILRAINAKVEGSILQSSKMGKSVYEKLGFETMYDLKQYSIAKA
jgi:ribosomal protein S18 acetylase RimI-like enzyme